MLAGLAIEKYRTLIHAILTIFIRNSLPEIRSHLIQNMDTLCTISKAVLLAEKVQISKDLRGKTNINLLQLGEEEGDEKSSLDELKEEIAAIRHQIGSSSKKQIAAVFQRNSGGNRGGNPYKGGWSGRGSSGVGRGGSQPRSKVGDKRGTVVLRVRDVPKRDIALERDRRCRGQQMP